jgi:hypothetical protein
MMNNSSIFESYLKPRISPIDHYDEKYFFVMIFLNVQPFQLSDAVWFVYQTMLTCSFRFVHIPNNVALFDLYAYIPNTVAMYAPFDLYIYQTMLLCSYRFVYQTMQLFPFLFVHTPNNVAMFLSFCLRMFLFSFRFVHIYTKQCCLASIDLYRYIPNNLAMFLSICT